VRNEEIRRIRLQILELIIRERRLRWIGAWTRIKNRGLQNTSSGCIVRADGATREKRNGQRKIGWTTSDEI